MKLRGCKLWSWRWCVRMWATKSVQKNQTSVRRFVCRCVCVRVFANNHYNYPRTLVFHLRSKSWHQKTSKFKSGVPVLWAYFKDFLCPCLLSAWVISCCRALLECSFKCKALLKLLLLLCSFTLYAVLKKHLCVYVCMYVGIVTIALNDLEILTFQTGQPICS